MTVAWLLVPDRQICVFSKISWDFHVQHLQTWCETQKTLRGEWPDLFKLTEKLTQITTLQAFLLTTVKKSGYLTNYIFYNCTYIVIYYRQFHHGHPSPSPKYTHQTMGVDTIMPIPMCATLAYERAEFQVTVLSQCICQTAFCLNNVAPRVIQKQERRSRETEHEYSRQGKMEVTKRVCMRWG